MLLAKTLKKKATALPIYSKYSNDGTLQTEQITLNEYEVKSIFYISNFTRPNKFKQLYSINGK
jgi:hypothetical protein